MKYEQTMSLSTYILTKGISVLSNFFRSFYVSFCANIVIPIIAFFEPTKEILLVVIFTVAIDLLSGIAKARKLKEKITSFRLRDTVIKLFFYLSLILIVFGLQFVCLWNIPLVNIIGSFTIFAELISISENLDILTNNKLGISKFIKRIRSKWLKNVDDKIENTDNTNTKDTQ